MSIKQQLGLTYGVYMRGVNANTFFHFHAGAINYMKYVAHLPPAILMALRGHWT